MTFEPTTQFPVYLLWVNAHLPMFTIVSLQNRFWNIKVLLGTFIQENALVGSFFVTVKIQTQFGKIGRDAGVESLSSLLPQATSRHQTQTNYLETTSEKY